MRRFAIIFGILAVVLMAVAFTLPWWLGAALTRFGPSWGVTVGDYQRIGYARFQVSDVEVRHDRVLVKVAKGEGDTPLLWLWRRWTGKPGVVVGGDWSVEVGPPNSITTSTAPRGWVPLERRLSKIADRLATWVPEVEAGKGVVTWPRGELTLAGATWRDRTVTTPDLGYRSWHAAVTGTFAKEGGIEARAKMLDDSAEAALRSDGLALNGDVAWWEQPAKFAAAFNEEGWLPREATLKAENWEVAGDRVKLGKHYTLVRGHGFVEWSESQLKTELSITGEPVENTQAPPLSVELRGHGADEVFVAETLNVSMPGINASLSAPVAIDREGRLHSEPSDFTLSADLAQQPWFAAKGNLQGTGRISAGADGRLLIDFSAGGENVEALAVAISRVNARGQLEWPLLHFAEGMIATPDGSELTWQGGWNIRTHSVVKAEANGQVDRALLTRWLPEYPEFDTLRIEAKADGPWATAAHEGRAEIAQLRFKQTHPLAVKLDWTGNGLTVEKFATEIRADQTSVLAEGAANRNSLTLNSLAFANGDEPRLQLVKPATLRWDQGIQVNDLDLRGPKGNLRASLRWGDEGSVELRAEHISSEWVRPLLILPPTNWGVDSLEATGRWEGGPAEYKVNANVTVHLGENRAAQVVAVFNGSADGVEITSMKIAEAGSVIANATGRVPFVIQPGAETKWLIEKNGPFAFDAATSANPGFWQEIMRLTGVEIVQPEVAVHLDGSLNEPRGEVRLSAARVAPVEGRIKGEWPKIEKLKLHAIGDGEGVQLDEFAFTVEEQAVLVSGRIPLKFDDWNELRNHPREFAQRGQVRIQIPDAEIAAFDQYFPQYIAPKGRFQVDLTLQGEESVDGFIRLQNGTSRPLGPLGVLQEINADIRFHGRTADFHGVTARMGGQTVTLQGRAELPVNEQPQLNLTLTGQNLPFVRRSGLLIRGDLDLQLLTRNGGDPIIQGVVRLRDSLFLADIRSLIPSGTKGVAARPPYFSVDTPPLNTWALDVSVTGDEFLRLRTPVFNGTASAKFRLDGTLGQPRIGGEAIINQGNIRLPFANFEVSQGEVRLSPGQVEPQLFVNATTRRYGYDLRMEISGGTSAPNLVFSSSPPLEAEQVLLMVMAGDAPSNEITSTERQRVARFGAFFGQSLLGSLRGDTSGPDRLTISSGGDISEQGRETYDIEYKLDKRWSLTGEYDEFDDYYGGLKWRIYPKSDKKAADDE